MKENEVENQISFYAVIPSYVLFDKEISDGAKILYGAISSLTKKEGYCWANNRYFCDMWNINVSTVQRRLAELRDAGHIKIEFYISDGDRKIWINTPIAKTPYSHSKNAVSPTQKCHTYNIIDNNKEITTLASIEKTTFDFSTSKFVNLSKIDKYKEKYPAIDVNVEILKMEAWLMSNPKNRKTNYERFINNWLSKAQDKARTGNFELQNNACIEQKRYF